MVLLATLLAACGGGGGGSDIPVSMTLDGAASTPSEIFMSWTPQPGTVSGYDLYRNNIAVADTHLSSTSFTDRNLEPASRYCYHVLAVTFPLGVVGQSNLQCITTPGIEAWHREVVAPGSTADLALDAANRPQLALQSEGQVIVAGWTGTGWQTSAVAAVGGAVEVGLELDPVGARHVSYPDGTGDALVHADDGTGPWLLETVDSAAGPVHALALDAGGAAHLVYGKADGLGTDLYHASNSPGSWVSERLLGLSDTRLADADMLVDSAGVVHMALTLGDAAGCSVLYMRGAGGSWTEQWLAADSYCGVALALDPDGSLHLAYTRRLDLVHGVLASGSWLPETLDSFSWIGGQRLGMAVDPAGRVHLAYQDQNQDLKYATNQGGTWDYYFIDASCNVGGQPAIAVDAAGTIYISYLDACDGTVKLAISR